MNAASKRMDILLMFAEHHERYERWAAMFEWRGQVWEAKRCASIARKAKEAAIDHGFTEAEFNAKYDEVIATKGGE